MSEDRIEAALYKEKLAMAIDALSDLLETHEHEPDRPAVRFARETLAKLTD